MICPALWACFADRFVAPVLRMQRTPTGRRSSVTSLLCFSYLPPSVRYQHAQAKKLRSVGEIAFGISNHSRPGKLKGSGASPVPSNTNRKSLICVKKPAIIARNSKADLK
jgi:hypothetical protein